MSIITTVPEPNIWEEIIEDFKRKETAFEDDQVEPVMIDKESYDASKHNPVFYTTDKELSARVQGDCDLTEEFNAAAYHPATVGFSFVQKPPKSPPPPTPSPPDKKTCPPTQYLEHYVFPVLLPALEEMLKAAKDEKCFEKLLTKFNACDFLTEYLYSHNPDFPTRDGTKLEDIPFVAEHWKHHPRPPLPKSIIWSEEEAALILQSFWRGYKVRIEPDVQELRTWQKEWAEENANIKERVDNFWAKKMPETDDVIDETPLSSVEPSELDLTSSAIMNDASQEPAEKDYFVVCG